MADPLGTGIDFAYMNSAYRLSECAIKFHSVESENGVFVSMIQRVRLDVEETERLLCIPSVKATLISTPAKLPWIRETVISAKTALNEIGRWVERVRVEREGYGKVSLETRTRWVFNDYEKIVNRTMELNTSHRALSIVLAYLVPLEQAETPEDPTPPLYDNATFFDDFLSPRQKRKVRDMKRRLLEEKKGNETFEEGVHQSVQVPIPVFFASPSIPRKEEILSDTDSSQTSSLSFPLSWSTTPGTRPIPSRPPISPQPLDPSSTWPFPQAPPPAFQPPGSQTPQYSTSTKTYTSDIYPRNIASRQPASELPSVSGTNFLGPLDPFELFVSSDSQTSSICSKNMHPVLSELSSSTYRPLSLQNLPDPPKTPQSLAETGPIAEMMGDLSMPHSETHSSLQAIPENICFVQSPPTNLPRELRAGVPPQPGIPISQSKIPNDATNRRAMWSAPATGVLAEPYHSVKRPQKPRHFSTDAPALTCAGMLSDGMLQVTQAHQEHPPSTTSWRKVMVAAFIDLWRSHTLNGCWNIPNAWANRWTLWKPC
jgi:hypothetical protein